MPDDRIDELLAEIERLRSALEAIQNTPRKDGILTCQRIATEALRGGQAVLQPRQKSLGDPVYFRDVIGYLHWRYKGRCVYCDRSDQKLEIDHLTPVSRGGSDDIANLVLACHDCNVKKGTQTATEFGFRELALITAGASLKGWRRRAEQDQHELDHLRRVLGELKTETGQS